MKQSKREPSDHRTFRGSHAVRLAGHDYTDDVPIHLTLTARCNMLTDASTPQMICDSVATCSRRVGYRLYGFCLMPDHLHVLLSPHQSGHSIDTWLQRFKSYTAHAFVRGGGRPPLWQRSAYDHVCRKGETAETVLRYIVENPIRAGLVDDVTEWPWTQVFIDI